MTGQGLILFLAWLEKISSYIVVPTDQCYMLLSTWKHARKNLVQCSIHIFKVQHVFLFQRFDLFVFTRKPLEFSKFVITVIIFRPHIMGEENHSWVAFFSKFCQISSQFLRPHL